MSGRERSRSPVGQRRTTRERTPPRRRTLPPEAPRRSRSPESSRPRKRPGRTSRLNAADQKTLEANRQQREEEQRLRAKEDARRRGGYDNMVTQHYNAVPQMGKEWRGTESKIKGLRNLNNWIKSCVIQKFSPSGSYERDGGPDQRHHNENLPGLRVLDIGCGKGGDLAKWNLAPQRIELYVGLDPADVSIDQARGRYTEMVNKARRFRRPDRPLFESQFAVKDCFGSWIGDVPIVNEVGIDGSVGPDGKPHLARHGGGGFDVVSMMFCLHYAFESEEKTRNMLRNVAGSLKKGGRFLGVMPNSENIESKVAEYNAKRGIKPAVESAEQEDSEDEWDPEKPSEVSPAVLVPAVANTDTAEALEWGNDIYRIRMPNAARLPVDGVFRPPFGWMYNYFLEEAVEVPEFVVPWEALRALAVEYNLELEYRKPFNEIYNDEREDPLLGRQELIQRMGVHDRDGKSTVSESEMEAAAFYVGFSFYKV